MEITPEQKNLKNTTIFAIIKDLFFFFFQIPGYSSKAWAGWPLAASAEAPGFQAAASKGSEPQNPGPWAPQS